MIKNVLKVSAIVLIFGLASGCVSQESALAKKDGKAALPTLTAALENEKSKPVRQELEKAIKRLSK